MSEILTSTIISKAILLALMQFLFSSIILTNTTNLLQLTINLNNNQKNDNHSLESKMFIKAQNALYQYIFFGVLWTISVSLLMYQNYKLNGFLYTLFTNIIVLILIYFIYLHIFKEIYTK